MYGEILCGDGGGGGGGRKEVKGRKEGERKILIPWKYKRRRGKMGRVSVLWEGKM